MQRKALLLLLLTCLCGFSLQAQDQQTTLVHFALDSDELAPEARLQLNDLLQSIQQFDRWQLQVRAHTDASGSDAYNDALAERRAEAVRNYLIAGNLPVEQVQIAAFGEHRPTESNENETGRSLNRRVEIVLQTWPLNDLQDLMQGLQGQSSQQFTFTGDQPIELHGKDGAGLWIPAGLFVFADGSPATGNIALELREAYTYADMIAHGLSTHSGNELLETGGMVYLQARSEGQELQIRPGGELLLAMPTEEQLAGMQLFTGETDAAGNLLDWTPTGQAFSKNKMAVLRIAEPPPMPDIRTELTFFKFDESGEPVAPGRPLEPAYPKEPNRESIKYRPGFFQRLALGRKKIREREEAMYAQKLEQYEARLERYPVLMEAYALEMEAFRLEMQDYEEAKAAWQAGLQEQWKAHQASRREKYKDAYAAAEAKYRKALEAYEQYKIRKIAAYEAAVEKGNMDQSSLKNYFFAVNRLGWINCDRFNDLADSQKAPLLVRDEDEQQDEMVFVLFTDMRSALRTFRKDGHYASQAVPKGATAKVVGLKVQNGRPMMAVKEISVGENNSLSLEYEPRRLAEIRETLAALD